MKNKYRDFVFGAACVFVALAANAGDSIGAWSDSPVGQCFNSVNEYMLMRYGDEYQADENVQAAELPVKKAAGPSESSFTRYTWVNDLTAGTNITRTLLASSNSGKVCAILYAPLSSDISLKWLSSNNLPLKVVTDDSPSPGFDGNRVIYRFDRKSKTYAPAECFRIKPSKRIVRSPCANAFVD